jgi:RNA polymerase sigma-70 factor (ECF subfamily)
MIIRQTAHSMNDTVPAQHDDFEREAVPHMDALYNYALTLTGNRDEASDLLQETYLKAYRFFASFQRGTNCKAWLFQIMKNSFINRYRKQNREPAKVSYDTVEEYFDTIRSEEISLNDLEKVLFTNHLGDEVNQALQSLPDIFREILLLSDIEEMTYEEIAKVIDCPIGTVRSRLHRARKAMFVALYDYAKQNGLLSD